MIALSSNQQLSLALVHGATALRYYFFINDRIHVLDVVGAHTSHGSDTARTSYKVPKHNVDT